MKRMLDFLRRHKLVLIGLVLYLTAYWLNNRFPPWPDLYDMVEVPDWAKANTTAYASGGFLDSCVPRILSDNRLIQKIPLDILYFGVADVAAIVHFEIWLPAALITYGAFLMQLTLEKLYGLSAAPPGRKERLLITHLYCNTLFYPLSFLMQFLQPYCENLPDKMVDLLNRSTSSKALGIAVFVLLFALLIVIVVFFSVPMLVNQLFFFGYIIAFKPLGRLIEWLDERAFGRLFGNTFFPREVLSFAVAFLLIDIGNFLLERLLDFFQGLSILPTKTLLKRVFR